MRKRLRVCRIPNCPNLSMNSLCPTHTAARELTRGTRQQRGYDSAHDRTRRAWQTRIDRREIVHCARCGLIITASMTWALDHNDDRTGYLGPSHTRCNNAAGGRASHSQR